MRHAILLRSVARLLKDGESLVDAAYMWRRHPHMLWYGGAAFAALVAVAAAVGWQDWPARDRIRSGRRRHRYLFDNRLPGARQNPRTARPFQSVTDPPGSSINYGVLPDYDSDRNGRRQHARNLLEFCRRLIHGSEELRTFNPADRHLLRRNNPRRFGITHVRHSRPIDLRNELVDLLAGGHPR